MSFAHRSTASQHFAAEGVPYCMEAAIRGDEP
jgi:hypothetical protein